MVRWPVVVGRCGDEGAGRLTARRPTGHRRRHRWTPVTTASGSCRRTTATDEATRVAHRRAARRPGGLVPADQVGVAVVTVALEGGELLGGGFPAGSDRAAEEGGQPIGVAGPVRGPLLQAERGLAVGASNESGKAGLMPARGRRPARVRDPSAARWPWPGPTRGRTCPWRRGRRTRPGEVAEGQVDDAFHRPVLREAATQAADPRSKSATKSPRRSPAAPRSAPHRSRRRRRRITGRPRCGSDIGHFQGAHGVDLARSFGRSGEYGTSALDSLQWLDTHRASPARCLSGLPDGRPESGGTRSATPAASATAARCGTRRRRSSPSP